MRSYRIAVALGNSFLFEPFFPPLHCSPRHRPERTELRSYSKMATTKRTIASFFAPEAKRRSKQEPELMFGSLGPSADNDVPDSKPKVTMEQGNSRNSSSSESADSHEPQLTWTQTMRSAASRNLALAKLAVKQAESQMETPKLKALLIEKSWQEQIGSEFEKTYFHQLEKFVHQEWAGRIPIFPPKDGIFRAFNSTPFENIKVVILGQDPYHEPNQAVGLCFSVPADQKRPSSLLNIYKELHTDCGCKIVSHGNLEAWATQGILMLNTVLTVRAHQANSHARKGWEVFTDMAIQTISRNRRGVVFLLWGKQAQDKARLIDSTRHHILTSAHPSGLSAHRGFFGCRHFSKTNEILQQQGLEPIDWQV